VKWGIKLERKSHKLGVPELTSAPGWGMCNLPRRVQLSQNLEANVKLPEKEYVRVLQYRMSLR
jgi:hypothetical protein